MKYVKKEYVPKYTESQFVRYCKMPPWTNPMKRCEMCDVNFDYLDYTKDLIVLAEDSERRFYFCDKCWKSDQTFTPEED